MSAAAEWTLITVTFNSARHLTERWKAVVAAGARWIVVDNHSTDGSAELAEGLGADVVRLPVNVGFARANNQALRLAKSEFVAFINPDIWLKPDDLKILAMTCRQTNGLVAPQLINPDGSAQSNARGLPFVVDKLAHRGMKLPGSRLAEYLPRPPASSTGSEQLAAWVIGAAIAGRRTSILDIGGWDERFFLYYEDHRLGLQAWQAGYSVTVERSVRWVHEWDRATTRFELAPWRRELASAARFYALYPHLIFPFRRLMAERLVGWQRRAIQRASK